MINIWNPLFKCDTNKSGKNEEKSNECKKNGKKKEANFKETTEPNMMFTCNKHESRLRTESYTWKF